MTDFREETIQLIRYIARDDFPNLNNDNVEAFYDAHEAELINAAVKNELGYYIGYTLEGDRQKREGCVRRG